MMSKKQLSSSLEDYLEAIHVLAQDNSQVHAQKITDYMRVAKSSVSWALRELSKKGLVNYTPYEPISLTEKGRQRALYVVYRHEEIKRFLTDVLAVDEDTAQANACRMEHVIDPEVLLRMKCFLDATGEENGQIKAKDKPLDAEEPSEIVPKESKVRDRNTLRRLREVLAASGREMSIQEAMVASVFLTTERHLSLDELFEQIRQKEPTLRREDVAGAMKLLCEHKIARQLKVPNRTVYEHWHPESHHDHLFCVKCGAIIEFYDPRIEMLQMENAKRCSFRLLQHTLNLYGVCDACVGEEGSVRALTECLAGESVRVVRVEGEEFSARRMQDMGIRVDGFLEVVSPDGPGGSVLVLVGQGRVMLDRDSAGQVKVTAAGDEHVPVRHRRRARHRHGADRPEEGHGR